MSAALRPPLLSAETPAMPAELLEQLVGDTGEPERVLDAARAFGIRSLPKLREACAALMTDPFDLDFRDARIQRFAQVKPAPQDNAALVVIGSETSPDALVICADASAIAIMVAAMFGADQALPVVALGRPATPTELDIVTLVFEAVAGSLNGAGERSLALRMPLPEVLAGKDLDKRVFRDGPAVTLIFSASVAGGSGEITITLPQRVFLQHRTPEAGSVADAAPAWRNRFSEEIRRSQVELTATVAIDRMTLGELAGLQVGQVIAMPKGAQATTRLAARGRTLYVCEFGKLGQNYTVRVSDHYDAGKEFIDELLPE